MASQLHNDFRKNIKDRLAESDLNQTQLAERLGVSRAYVSQLISGRNVPTLDLVERVSIALECEAFELLQPTAEKVTA